jgi:hypothetical protein
MKKLYERGFLNSDEGTAFYEVSAEREIEDGWISANFKLSDCSRIVEIDFSSYNDSRQHRRRIKKVEKLIASLTTLKAWLEANK